MRPLVCAFLVGVTTLVIGTGAVEASGTPAATCAAKKQKAAGQKVARKLRCYAAAAQRNVPVNASCLAHVESKFLDATAAAEATGGCLSPGDASAVEAEVDVCVSSLVSLEPAATTSTVTTTTTASTTTTTTLSHCFTDMGDGTIQDSCTGLQWEKKSNAPGLNNVNNLYDWAGCCGGPCDGTNYCQPNAAAAATCASMADGGNPIGGCNTCASGTCEVGFGPGAVTTVWDWLNQLNAANFAGHNDWRLPSENGNNLMFPMPRELETLVLSPEPCGVSPCIDSIFGPTAAGFYWSATILSADPGFVLGVSFSTASGLSNGTEGDDEYVRAVR
jgi:hypothetical protein